MYICKMGPVSYRTYQNLNLSRFPGLRMTRSSANFYLNTQRKSIRTIWTGHSTFFFTAPKITFFRLVMTGGATTFGYISYKINSK